MKIITRKNAGVVIILFAGLICHAAGHAWQAVGVPLFVFLAILLIIFRQRRHTGNSETALAQQQDDQGVSRLTEKEINDDLAAVHVSALGSVHRRQQRQQTEIVVDEILDICIKLIAAHIRAHKTIGIFFPTADGGYKLRRYVSESVSINKDAVIYPGVGVIGAFLKDGLKQLNLKEIMSDSMTLYYYTKDAGIRSLMASPIIANGIERGTIIVDSTQKKNFTDEDHAYLTSIAAIAGHAVYFAYLQTEHRLEHLGLAAMSNIEKEFFSNLNLDAILDKMTEIIPFAISCNRVTISLKDEDGHRGKIVRAWGEHAESFKDKKFDLWEKSLASILYTKNIGFDRNFSRDHYEIRYFQEEPQHEEFGSFLAVPLGVDDCKGLILLESFRNDGFSESNRDLLSRIAISAGLAIEKIMVLEKANAMATHDGLTGLSNHRQFQQTIKDEITRAIRYNDPLALVLCDIDFFKKCNDTHGHQFGDIVLKGIAEKLQLSIREGIDTASRYGGEEFALVLVKTDEQGAVETAERIRQLIESSPFQTPTGTEMRITMSFGIAIYRQHAKQLDELIKKADKALYRAKETGRNKVEVF